MFKLRKLGDSNPRYGYPYGSLANYWFQPLTQTSLRSFDVITESFSLISWLRMQRYEYIFISPNFSLTFSRFFCIFLDFSSVKDEERDVHLIIYILDFASFSTYKTVNDGIWMRWWGGDRWRNGEMEEMERWKKWRDGEMERWRAEARRICHNKEKGDAKIHKTLARDDGWSKNLL